MNVQSYKKPLEQMIAAIDALNLDPIKFKLMESDEGEGWSRRYVDLMEIEYKRYLKLEAKYPKTVVPSKDIDAFWHAHILDTEKYAEDCQSIFGEFLHHFPYFGMRGEEDAANLKNAGELTARLYREEFGEMVATPETTEAAFCCNCWTILPGGIHNRPTLAPAVKHMHAKKTAGTEAAFCCNCWTVLPGGNNVDNRPTLAPVT